MNSEISRNPERKNAEMGRVCQRAAVSLLVVCVVYGIQTFVAVSGSTQMKRAGIVVVGNALNASVLCSLLAYVAIGVWKGKRIIGALVLLGYLVFQACFAVALVLQDWDGYRASTFLRALHAVYLGTLVCASWFTIRAMTKRMT